MILNKRSNPRRAGSVSVSDSGFPLSCPACGAPLAYVRADGDTHLYRC
jgi:hypothetical protein